MKLNGLRSFVESLLAGDRRVQRARRRSRERVGRSVEGYEQRLLLTVDLSLVRDNEQSPSEWTDLQTLVDDTGRMYYAGDDGVHGAEVWTSDGTSAGTRLVKDLLPGAVGSDPVLLTLFNGELYFAANDGVHGSQVWKTDGTDAGTVMMTNAPETEIAPYEFASPEGVVDAGGILYFFAYDGVKGDQLWRTNGEVDQTTVVGDVFPENDYAFLTDLIAARDLPINSRGVYFGAGNASTGNGLWKVSLTTGLPIQVKSIATWTDISESGAGEIKFLTNLNNRLFFVSNDGVHGEELWVSDGTTAGTQMVKDINPNSSSIPTGRHGFGLIPFGSSVVFEADDGTNGIGLWISDGTEGGTRRLAAASGNGPFDVSEVVNATGQLFFSGDDGIHGRELWASDGTNTYMVQDISATGSSDPHDLTWAGSTVYFVADDGVHGDELWRTVGLQSAVLYKDINPGPASAVSSLTGVGSTLLVTADDGVHGEELWIQDLPSGPLMLLKDINPGAGAAWPRNMFENDGTLYFMAVDESASYGLWKSDLTEAGTTKVAVTDVRTNDDWNFWALGGAHELYYVTRDGQELWVSNGSAGGTTRIMSNQPGAARMLYVDGDELYFVMGDGIHGEELWRTDGTEGGTELVKDINPGSGDSGPLWMSRAGDALYFSANDGVHGFELWRTDGTDAGTFLVKDINPGADSALQYYQSLDAIRDVAGTFYFTADDGVHGRELWKSDGTDAGTMLVRDILLGGEPFYEESVALNGMLYFVVNIFGSGETLWRSDGTELGTRMVMDGDPLAWGRVIGLRVLNGKLIFRRIDPEGSITLWTSDGTSDGTVLLKDFDPDSTNGGPGYWWADLNGFAYFLAFTANNDSQLWRTDGTVGGTTLVKEIAPGPNAPGFGDLTVVNGAIYFWVEDQGITLWHSDGTEQGTGPISGVNLEREHLKIEDIQDNVFSANGAFFFMADDGIHGRELWSVRTLPESAGVFRDGSFYLDANNSMKWESGGQSLLNSVQDQRVRFGIAGDVPVTGDWNGDGVKDVGVFRNGTWYLDQNGNFQWNGIGGGDVSFKFGIAGDTPISGDWNGDGVTDIGVQRNDLFYLDLNGNHKWDSGVDAFFRFGNSGDKAVTGDWNGDGKTEIGVLRGSRWYLDLDGNRKWNAGDLSFNFGTAGDLPVSGDWNADGKTDVGVFRSGYYYLDRDGNHKWGGNDVRFGFGNVSDVPVVGTWNLNVPAVSNPSPAPAALVVKAPDGVVSASEIAAETSLAGKVKKHALKKSHRGKS